MTADVAPSGRALLARFATVWGLVLTLSAFVGSSGCSSAPTLPMSASTPDRIAIRAADGRATALRIGARRAYWVWKDEDGVWHLRTTAGQSGRAYEGVIRPLPGAEITDLKPVGLGPNAELGMTGRTLTFRFRTRNGVDGFDFRLNGSACVEFDLRIDGDGDPAHIYLGRTQQRPALQHFLLCP